MGFLKATKNWLLGNRDPAADKRAVKKMAQDIERTAAMVREAHLSLKAKRAAPPPELMAVK